MQQSAYKISISACQFQTFKQRESSKDGNTQGSQKETGQSNVMARPLIKAEGFRL